MHPCPLADPDPLGRRLVSDVIQYPPLPVRQNELSGFAKDSNPLSIGHMNGGGQRRYASVCPTRHLKLLKCGLDLGPAVSQRSRAVRYQKGQDGRDLQHCLTRSAHRRALLPMAPSQISTSWVEAKGLMRENFTLDQAAAAVPQSRPTPVYYEPSSPYGSSPASRSPVRLSPFCIGWFFRRTSATTDWPTRIACRRSTLTA
jgi:hypothetical protein